MKSFSEMYVMVNGAKLNEAELMTLHTALNNFYIDLKDGPLKEDSLRSYHMEHIKSIQRLMIKI